MLEVISLSSSLNVHALKPLLLPLLSPERDIWIATQYDDQNRPNEWRNSWVKDQKKWFLVMSKMFCLRTQLQSLSLEYPQAGDCAPLSPERCKKALQPFTGALCWATLLNTSAFGGTTAVDGCFAVGSAYHISTCFDCWKIHTGFKRKWTWMNLVSIDEGDFNWFHGLTRHGVNTTTGAWQNKAWAPHAFSHISHLTWTWDCFCANGLSMLRSNENWEKKH